jgi:hypothetical protein
LGKKEILVDNVGFAVTHADVWYSGNRDGYNEFGIKEAILAVVRCYAKFGSSNNNLSNFGHMHGRKLEIEILAPKMLEHNILQKHETKVAMVKLEIVGCITGAEGSTYCYETNFSGR